MDANYDRLENEIRNLRGRVLELEHLNKTLSKQYYELKKMIIGKEIDEYLENYKPKNKNQQ
jgi:hypothetical protein